MMKFTNLTSVILKVGQGDPDTIPSGLSMRGIYTPNVVILAHSLLKLLRKRVGRTDGQTRRQTNRRHYDDNTHWTKFDRGIKLETEGFPETFYKHAVKKKASCLIQTCNTNFLKSDCSEGRPAVNQKDLCNISTECM